MNKNSYFSEIYHEFIYKSRYSRYIEKEKRREEWEETIARYFNFMEKYLSENHNFDLNNDREMLETAVLNKKVMPSMRGLMTAGTALSRDECAIFNCSFAAIDNLRVFDEILYILMCGVGVGFSVETKHITKLPTLPDEFHNSKTIVVFDDSRIGWAKGLREWFSLLYSGQIPKYDVSKLRPAGAKLKTFGGRSSGPQPLVDLLEFTKRILVNAAGRKLTSLECHDIICKIGDIVVVGGVRRCLPSNARIQTTTGFIEIKDITTNDFVVSGGKIRKVIEKVYSGKQETLRINHKFGTLDCTKNHKVAIFDDFKNIVFINASELRTDDVLVWDGYGYDGIIQKLPEFIPSTHFKSKTVKVPTECNEDIAWLLGYIHGDGYISKKTIEISGSINDLSPLEKAKNIFENYFGISGVLKEDSHGGNGIRLRINSTQLATWFLQFKKANNPIVIPECIFASTKSVKMSYLMGVFDADGRITQNGGIDQVTTVYETFKNDIVTLLATCGIATKIYYKNNDKRRKSGVKAKDYWTVRIIGKTNRNMWSDNIDFSVSSKKQNYVDCKSSQNDFSWPYEFHQKHNDRDMSYETSVIEKEVCVDSKLYPSKINFVEKVFGEVDTYDIEVEDIHQFTVDGIIVHNSALISLSDITDEKIRHSKTGQWWITTPWRRLANNSAVYDEKPDFGTFMKEWLALYESKSGERGIFSRKAANHVINYSNEWRQANIGEHARLRKTNNDLGCNPCAEILLLPDEFCNLTSVQIKPEDTLETLLEKIRIATIIGTIQSCVTNFRYLRKTWQKNCEEERLLGVSLNGIFDNSLTNGKQGKKNLIHALQEMRRVAIETNIEWAEKLGINASVAITCTKPEGCLSLDTKIKTSNGIMSMAEIAEMLSDENIFEIDGGTWLKPTKTLMVYDENNKEQKITSLYINGISTVYQIEMDDGTIVKVTSEHKLKTTNGWKPAEELEEGDEIISF